MKKILPIAIIIISLGVAYYFIFALPKQSEREFTFKKKKECSQVCSKLYEEDEASSGETTILNPNYAYNQELNTCLYSGGLIGSGNNLENIVMITWVRDCFSNEELVGYSSVGDKVMSGGSLGEFDSKKDDLMVN